MKSWKPNIITAQILLLNVLLNSPIGGRCDGNGKAATETHQETDMSAAKC